MPGFWATVCFVSQIMIYQRRNFKYTTDDKCLILSIIIYFSPSFIVIFPYWDEYLWSCSWAAVKYPSNELKDIFPFSFPWLIHLHTNLLYYLIWYFFISGRDSEAGGEVQIETCGLYLYFLSVLIKPHLREKVNYIRKWISTS